MAKCSECGLLSLKKESDGIFYEVDTAYREGGHQYGVLSNGIISCVAMAFNLHAELCEQAKEDPSQGGELRRTLAVISKERDCQSSTRWIQSFTPKEHMEFIRSEDLRRETERRAQEDKEWREEIRKADAKRDEERRWTDKKWNFFQAFMILVLGGGIGLANNLITNALKEPAKQSVTQPSISVETPKPKDK